MSPTVAPGKIRLTSRYRFAASHRLHSSQLSEEENRKLYDKCNNPHGHGHDYQIEVTVEGAPGDDGQIVNRMALDRLVRERVLEKLDHRDLNTEVPEFEGGVTTTENLAKAIRKMLLAGWTLPAELVRIQISETARNTFAWDAGA